MTTTKRIVLFLILDASLLWAPLVVGSDNPILTQSIEEEFEYIKDNVRNALSSVV